jgi:N-methylhydantoinase A
VVTTVVADAAVGGSAAAPGEEAEPAERRLVRDTVTGAVSEWAIFDRSSLTGGAWITGPAIVAEDETSTLVGTGWTAALNGLGYIEIVRQG